VLDSAQLTTSEVCLPMSHIRARVPGLLLAVALLSLLLAGCGAEETPAPSPDPAQGDAVPTAPAGPAFESSLIANPGRTYTIDDLLAAGWKKSDQLSAETLPGATEVWYGFFSRKDIEVRVYESHDAAKQLGIEPAEATINASPGARGGDHGPWTPRIARYAAYAVVGNMVILCELELAPCEALAEALK